MEQRRQFRCLTSRPVLFDVIMGRKTLRWFSRWTLVLLLASCARRIPTPLEPHVLLYRQGLDAFRQATPEAYQRAITAFHRAAELSPSHCEYWLHLAESLLFLAKEQQRNWDEFRPRVTEAIEVVDAKESTQECKVYGSFVARLRALAWSPQFGAGRAEEVQAMIDRAIEGDAKDPMNWLVGWQLNRNETGDRIIRAAELSPELPLIQYELGNHRLDRGEYSAARKAFESTLQSSPRHVMSMLALAYSVATSDPDADVLPLYRRAVEVEPGFLAGRLFLGDYYSGLQELEPAVEQYRVALLLKPDYYPALIALGSTLLQMDRLDEAEEHLRSAIALDLSAKQSPMDYRSPTSCNAECADSNAHYWLGFVNLRRGDSAQAETQFREALRRVQNFDAMVGLGMVLRSQGKIDEALVQYQNALRFEQYLKDPPRESQLADVYFSRAAIRSELRQFTEAISDYDRAIDIYGRQIKQLEVQSALSESRGRNLKAESERKRKTEMEQRLRQAQQAKRGG
jgi:tetratricopeptide (TPR) repeat protein